MASYLPDKRSLCGFIREENIRQRAVAKGKEQSQKAKNKCSKRSPDEVNKQSSLNNKRMILSNGKVFLNGSFQEGIAIHVADSKIRALEQTTKADDLDLKGKLVVPGCIDLQLNGGGGVFFANDVSIEGIRQIHKTHLKYGTTSFLITLTTSAFENISKAIDVVRAYQKQYSGLLGLHIEGPYINPIKKGAHPQEYIREPNLEEIKTFMEYGKDVIKILTIAPEVCSPEILDYLKSTGVTISAGHSMATYEEATKSFGAGVNMITHLYNAMSPLESRAPGLVGAAMNRPDIWASIIVDGKHCDYASIELAYKLKKERLILISDAAYKDEVGTSFQFGATKVRYIDGFYYNQEGRLAGSSISMYEAVLNSSNHANIPFEVSLEMASKRPAELLGLSGVGEIAVGCDADLLILNEDRSLEMVLFKGKMV